MPKLWRNRVEVYILKDNQILVGIHPEIGYQVPGGGVEPNQTLFKAAEIECLEEVGVKIKNIKFALNKNYYEDWYKLVQNGVPITKKDRQRMVKYRGIKHNFLKADFDGYDNRLFGSQNDKLKKIQFWDKKRLINEFIKQGKKFEPALYNMRIEAIKNL
jgi:8-oxo-dGTP pyrophosphatase MutT (NUDIX family)